MGNRNSSSSKVHGHVKRAASTELAYDKRVGMPIARFRDEYMSKPKAETPAGITLKGQRGSGMYLDQQQRNAPLDNDETFASFIQHAKYKTRTMSHIDREQNNVVAPPAPDEEANAGGDGQNDQFSNFIASAKKKLRTTSSIRRNGSFNTT
ncbi:hypothetical protein Fmac_029886 [Flemingia macrophylla]|uniref:Uncharacterized protein n=1 Tax=Flemingia macrophylla TaxID=520843 RepID=A0ABD1LBM6_9FABA